jgi:hypothetical protein
MENVVLWPYGIFYYLLIYIFWHTEYFFLFGFVVPRKNLAIHWHKLVLEVDIYYVLPTLV